MLNRQLVTEIRQHSMVVINDGNIKCIQYKKEEKQYFLGLIIYQVRITIQMVKALENQECPPYIEGTHSS